MKTLGMTSLYFKCDVKIPKSGKKLEKIGDYTFFFRTVKRLTWVYEVSTETLILVTPESKGKDYIINKITERMDEVDEFIKDYNEY
jgi:hypothetical protein